VWDFHVSDYNPLIIEKDGLLLFFNKDYERKNWNIKTRTNDISPHLILF